MPINPDILPLHGEPYDPKGGEKVRELPADIKAAIDAFAAAAGTFGGLLLLEPSARSQHYHQSRASLEASILKRLSIEDERDAEVTCLTIRAEKAEAENTQLRERLDDKTNGLRVEIAAKLGAYNEIKMLEEENARLRAALTQIAQQDRGGLQGLDEDGRSEDDAVAYLISQIERRRKIARAALADPATAEEI